MGCDIVFGLYFLRGNEAEKGKGRSGASSTFEHSHAMDYLVRHMKFKEISRPVLVKWISISGLLPSA